MNQEPLGNPFMIVSYNHSWTEIRTQVNELISRFPNRYRMAYYDDDDQKIIIFTSLDFRVFAKEKTSIVFISKIDADENCSLLAYETKNYSGDISNKEDFDRATYFMHALSDDLLLVY